MQTGYGHDGMIEVADGLSDDDAVVTVGQIGLKPDAKVSVINAPASEEGAEETTGAEDES